MSFTIKPRPIRKRACTTVLDIATFSITEIHQRWCLPTKEIDQTIGQRIFLLKMDLAKCTEMKEMVMSPMRPSFSLK
jgi:hypothetical protein